MQFHWVNTEFFWALLFVPFFTGVMFWQGRRFPGTLSGLRFIVLPLAFSLLILGLARPQRGIRSMKKGNFRANVVLAIDVSRSMIARDIAPNRLAFAISFSQKLLTQLEGIQASLFPFSEDGYFQFPFTTDLFAVSGMLSSLSPSITTLPGSDIGYSLSTLFKQLSQMEKKRIGRGGEKAPTIVVLLSDGETHSNIDTSVLAKFRQERVPIYTVGVGTVEGTQIPLDVDFTASHNEETKSNSIRNLASPRVHSRLVAAPLQQIARETGGEFFSPRFSEVHTLSERLQSKMRFGKLNSSFKAEQEYYPVLILLSLLLFFVEFCRGRWQFALRTLLLIFLLKSAPISADERRAVELYNSAVLFNRNDLVRSGQLYQEALSTTESGTLKKKIFFNLGNTLLKMGDPIQAIYAFQMALDTHSDNPEFEKASNEKASENIELAYRILKQQAQRQNGGEPNENGNGNAEDPKAPKKQYLAVQFSQSQKEKLFELLSNEEQQILQRLQDRNQNQSRKRSSKPW